MSETDTDPKHFTRAVTELGEVRPVLTHCAIFNSQGVKIIDQGVAVNLGLYERLMQHRLSAPIEDSVSSEGAVTGAMLRVSVEAALASVPFYGRMAHDQASRNLLLDTIEKLALPAPMAFQLTLAREVRPEVYLNSVRAALTAAWLARAPLVSRYDIGMAAAAGLLHDVGMLHIDPTLLQPARALDRSLRRQLYSHPLISTALLQRQHVYPKEVIRAVGEHHEFLNGSGYPRNLVGEAISPLGRILALTELVTAIFASGREAPELRLSVVLRMNQHRYDPGLCSRIMGLLQLESDPGIGSDVMLEDPVQRLLDLNQLLCAWPVALRQDPGLSAERQHGLDMLARQVSELHRALAASGAEAQQLCYLGAEPLGEHLRFELSLLAGEAAWQLRALARQSRRRWRLEIDASYPPSLAEWLERADALVAPIAEADAPGQQVQ